jgi:hypothetical protein
MAQRHSKLDNLVWSQQRFPATFDDNLSNSTEANKSPAEPSRLYQGATLAGLYAQPLLLLGTLSKRNPQ